MTLEDLEKIPPMPPVITLVNRIKSMTIPNLTVCEIGVFIGGTSKLYAPHVKSRGGRIILIDPFNEYTTKEMVEVNLASVGCLDICEIIEGKSQEVSHFIPDNSLDVCFIDGCHNYSCVKKDIELYTPKVKKGGLLCGHDFDGIQFVNRWTDPKDLEADGIPGGPHAGVIQAVFDSFGYDFTWGRDGNDNSPCSWFKVIV